MQLHLFFRVTQFFRRILGEGLTELAENQLISMKSSIMKLNKNLKKSQNKSSTNGKIAIDSTLEVGQELILVDSKRHMANRSTDTDSMNSEWPRLFAHTEKPSSSDYHSAATSNPHFTETPTTSLVEYSIPEKNFIQGKIRENLLRY